MFIRKGILSTACQVPSCHFDQRPSDVEVSLLVIHNISLPPGNFGGNNVQDFFIGQLDRCADPFFQEIADLKVSAHLYIRRDGEVIQFVNFNLRAWHAGQSEFQDRKNCNDFSIGIELEGTDSISYTDKQYLQLSLLTKLIMQEYPQISINRICGHSEIAPQRKTDPGMSFDWTRYRQSL